MAKMFYCSNIFALVSSPKKNNNLSKKEVEVIIWDYINKRPRYKYLLKKEVLNLELTSNKIIVICEKKIFIFNINDFQLIDIINTGLNLKGIFSVSYKENNILVYPSIEKEFGKLTIKNYDTKSYLYLNPHNKAISSISLNYNGLFLATASEEEKIIKIFDVKTGNFLKELNKFICFSINPDNNLISFPYKKGFIPIWSSKTEKDYKDNFSSSIFPILDISILKKISKAEYKAEKYGDKNILYVLTSTGESYKLLIDNSNQKDIKLKILGMNKI